MEGNGALRKGGLRNPQRAEFLLTRLGRIPPLSTCRMGEVGPSLLWLSGTTNRSVHFSPKRVALLSRH